MAKLPVRLFVLIVLGTISSCEAVGPHPDSTAVMTASASLSVCSKFRTVNVRFSKLRVRGTDSDVVYQRTTITEQRLQYAAIGTVDLPSTNIVVCAQAAAAEGLDAFIFDGSCTGYQLRAAPFKCMTDTIVIFVRLDKLANELWINNLERSDLRYKRVQTDGSFRYFQYMMSSFIDPEPSNLFYKEASFEDMIHDDSFITLENGDTFLAKVRAVDYRSCLTARNDSGVTILISAYYYEMNLALGYFLNECGNTIRIPRTSQAYYTFVYFHEGVGCVDNPSEVPDECTVTFDTDEPSKFIECRFSDRRLADGCPGFNMTFTGSSLRSNQTETIYSCTNAYDLIAINGYPTYTISLHSSTPKSQFSCILG
ncbi:hypothetical protein FHG87_007140 [Trinorchestia longiramus]|nr:hypothetical protein FHG87_007140 [Trinorchestia longiramus]